MSIYFVQWISNLLARFACLELLRSCDTEDGSRHKAVIQLFDLVAPDRSLNPTRLRRVVFQPFLRSSKHGIPIDYSYQAGDTVAGVVDFSDPLLNDKSLGDIDPMSTQEVEHLRLFMSLMREGKITLPRADAP